MNRNSEFIILEKNKKCCSCFSVQREIFFVLCSRIVCFRCRSMEKCDCLPLLIVLNNVRNALAGVKLAGAFLVEVIIKDL